VRVVRVERGRGPDGNGSHYSSVAWGWWDSSGVSSQL